MTVLQTVDSERNLSELPAFDRLLILSRSYVEAVAADDAHAHARGLDLAAAVEEFVEAARSSARRAAS